MFDDMTVEDMKIRPDLHGEEEVLVITGAKLGNTWRENTIIAITTDRILVRPKRGRNLSEDHAEKGNLEIELKEIDTVRHSGIVTKTIEIISDESVYELPPLQNDSKEIINALVNTAGLKKTEWGEESTGQRTTKGLIGGIVGILGLILGVFFILLGIVGIISIAGILVGIGSLVFGVIIMRGSWELIDWAFNKQEEWVRNGLDEN